MYKFLPVLLFILMQCSIAVAYDSEQQAKEIKDYQQRIYSQKELIQKLDMEVASLQNQLQNKSIENLTLTKQITSQKEQISTLKKQVMQFSIAQQILEQQTLKIRQYEAHVDLLQ